MSLLFFSHKRKKSFFETVRKSALIGRVRENYESNEKCVGALTERLSSEKKKGQFSFFRVFWRKFLIKM